MHFQMLSAGDLFLGMFHLANVYGYFNCSEEMKGN